MPTYTYTTLDDPAGNGGTGASGINDAGQIVGTYTVRTVDFHANIFSTTHGFIYAGGTYTTRDPGAAFNFANGINASGQIVGTYNYANFPYHGFLYSGGTYTSLDDPSASTTFPGGTQAEGINDAGQIVGHFDNATGRHGFFYNGGNFTTLDVSDPSARAGSTTASGINASGQIVGDYIDSGGTRHGFLYSGGTYTTLNDPFAINGDSSSTNGTFALGINNLGQIVGYYYGSGSTQHGFIYSGGRYITIDDPLAAKGTIATGIKQSGPDRRVLSGQE
jgi:probable HAF family extracellular repeat protein